MKKVIFFVKKFPILSQTFVIDQVNNLIDAGVDVEILSLYEAKQDVALDSLKKHKLLHRTTFIAPTMAQSTKKPIKLLFLIKFFVLVNTIETRLKPSMELAFHALKHGKLTLAYEISVTAWKNRKRQFKADSIIAHFGNNGVVANAFLKSGLLEGNLMTVFHGYEISEYENIKLWKDRYVSLSRTSLLLPISNFWKRRLESWGATSESVIVQRMGVDVSKFAFQTKQVEKPVQIVSVARATEKKGLKYAIEAMSFLDDNFHLNIIGGGELHNDLIQLSEKLNLSDKITFHGAKPPQFVKECLNKSDIFLLPSVVDSQGDMEGIPVALMEAMASGLTVVSTYHSGIPELIEDNVSGFLVPERDPKAIAEALKKVMTTDKLNDIRRQAREKVEKEFNSFTLSNELVALIESSSR